MPGSKGPLWWVQHQVKMRSGRCWLISLAGVTIRVHATKNSQNVK